MKEIKVIDEGPTPRWVLNLVAVVIFLIFTALMWNVGNQMS